ncbi:MAG TPA: CbbX protein [Candidatus Sulfotelmatobacter sp.]|jgi:probable Rubsico expression protein CbbX
MSDTNSYGHPGITDPEPNEAQRRSDLFAPAVSLSTADGDSASVAPQPPVDLQAQEIDLSKELAEAGVKEVLAELDQQLVGLTPVKTRIREISSLLLVEKLRRKLGLTSDPPTLHMSFTGNPGTGKTTVALRMANLLHHLGFIRKGHLISVTRDDLVGQYIGHTAPKTKEILKRAMGGVLFIDEAYYLYRAENERDYGQEAIEILLQIMENQREDLVVILAGYAKPMEKFFSSNPGFRSRIAHHIDFPDYDDAELLSIGEMILSNQNYKLSEKGRDALARYIVARKQQPHFSNARSIRNALDRARLRQANRIVQGATSSSKNTPAGQNGAHPGSSNRRISAGELMTIEAEDILASRVFDQNSLASSPLSEETERTYD